MKILQWLEINNISKDQYYYWQRKLKETCIDTLEKQAATFVGLPVTKEVPASTELTVTHSVCENKNDGCSFKDNTIAAVIKTIGVTFVFLFYLFVCKLRHRDIQLSYILEININLLDSVTGRFVRFVYHNFIYKFMNHRSSKLCEICVSVNQFNKLCFMFHHISAGSFDNFQKQITNNICSHMMLCTSVFKFALCLTVSGASVIVLCVGVLACMITIFVLLFITIRAMIEHLGITVGTINQSGLSKLVPDQPSSV